MASEDRKQQQPRLKKPKLGNNSNDDSSFGDNSLFIEFHEDKDILSRLKYAVTALNEGYNRMNLILVTVVEANARSSISFSRASCTTKLCKSDVFVAASVFQKGIEVLEQYIQSDELIKVPADVQQRNALHNLLQFLSEGKDASDYRRIVPGHLYLLCLSCFQLRKFSLYNKMHHLKLTLDLISFTTSSTFYQLESVYRKCSKISNTLKLRTPKIIAENNFQNILKN